MKINGIGQWAPSSSVPLFVHTLKNVPSNVLNLENVPSDMHTLEAVPSIAPIGMPKVVCCF